MALVVEAERAAECEADVIAVGQILLHVVVIVGVQEAAYLPVVTGKRCAKMPVDPDTRIVTPALKSPPLSGPKDVTTEERAVGK